MRVECLVGWEDGEGVRFREIREEGVRFEVLPGCTEALDEVVLPLAFLGVPLAAAACFCLVVACPFVVTCVFLTTGLARGCLDLRDAGGDWESRRARLMRPDLRLPFSVKEVGPSAPAFFHGGDSSFLPLMRAADGGGVDSWRRRLLDGGPSSASASS